MVFSQFHVLRFVNGVIMKFKKIGFIGCGKMAGAIIKGILKSGFISADRILASKSNKDNIKEISEKLGVKITLNNKEIAEFGDIIFIGVKPNQVKTVLNEIKGIITSDKLIVSMAAGVKISDIENVLPYSKIIRIMPNTPILVNEGMTGICGGKSVSENDLEQVLSIFNSIGKAVVVDETQMDIVTAVSGSGPAFFYKVINDIARAGEKLGMDYDKALILSIQTALGSAKMALNRQIPMEDLISNVATKGGCTFEGIEKMSESEEFFYKVIKATAEKARKLG